MPFTDLPLTMIPLIELDLQSNSNRGDMPVFDAKQTKSIVAIKPKPPFRPVFQVAASREGSDIRILNEPLEGSALFLVETGESRTPRPEEAVQDILQV